MPKSQPIKQESKTDDLRTNQANARFLIMNASHDGFYKRLFSHPRVVADFLRDFVHEEWVSGLNFESLQKLDASYVSNATRRREGDLVWRVKYGEEWLYIYLLLEFQSTIDYWMPLRMLTYIGLFYEDLVRTGKLQSQDKLPPVFPAVIYNGQSVWNAPREFANLVRPMPKSLQQYLPRLRYFLLDEGRIRNLTADNTFSSIVNLEQTRTPEQLIQALNALKRILKAPGNEGLQQTFVSWIQHMFIRPLGPDSPEVTILFKTLEDTGMLAESVTEWAEQYKREGLQKGLQEGLQKGLQEGERKGQSEMIWKMHQGGMSAEEIVRFSNLNVTQIKSILAEYKTH